MNARDLAEVDQKLESAFAVGMDVVRGIPQAYLPMVESIDQQGSFAQGWLADMAAGAEKASVFTSYDVLKDYLARVGFLALAKHDMEMQARLHT